MTNAAPAARKRRRRTITEGARQRIIELAGQRLSTYAIAKEMNASRFKPARAQTWSQEAVRAVLEADGLHSPRAYGGTPEPIQERIEAMYLSGALPPDIASTLTAEDVPTARGGQWHASLIRDILVRRGIIEGQSIESAGARFASRIKHRRNGCHEWLGRRDSRGRSSLTLNGKTVKAHRFAWLITHGSLDDNAKLRNTCGDSSCVNPAHWRIRENATAEFWARTQADTETGCVLWTGALNADGYGRFSRGGAHRFAYQLKYGQLPANTLLHHVCRNRACVNPAHLLPVDGPGNHSMLHRLEDEVEKAFADGTLHDEFTSDESGEWPSPITGREAGALGRVIGSLRPNEVDTTDDGESA